MGSAKHFYEPHPRKDGFSMKVFCEYCGRVFWESSSKAVLYKRHFCDKGCYSKFRKELLPKEEHNHYGKGMPKAEVEKRLRARAKVGHAIRDRRLVPLPCEICGDEMSEAHHNDYNKPLEVSWLCYKHHKEIHNEKS